MFQKIEFSLVMLMALSSPVTVFSDTSDGQNSSSLAKGDTSNIKDSDTIKPQAVYGIAWDVIEKGGACGKRRTNEMAKCHDPVSSDDTRWGDSEDVKPACCKFWEFELCIQKILDRYCGQELTNFTEDKALSNAKLQLQQGYCASYPLRSDCDFPILKVFAFVAGAVVVVIICGYGILKNLTRS